MLLVNGLFFNFFNFTILVLVLFVLSRKPVHNFFYGRRERLKKQISDCAENLKTARQRMKESQRAIEELPSFIDEKRRTSEVMCTDECKEIIEMAERKKQYIISGALRFAEEEKEKTMDGIRMRIISLAVMDAGKNLESMKGEVSFNERFAGASYDELSNSVNKVFGDGGTQ